MVTIFSPFSILSSEWILQSEVISGAGGGGGGALAEPSMLPINNIALEGTQEILLKHSHLTGKITRVERGDTVYPRPRENTVV